MSKLFRFELALCLILFASPVLDSYSKSTRSVRRQETTQRTTRDLSGQSRTLLPDGDLLLLGGEGANGPSSSAVIETAVSGQKTVLRVGLGHARYGHTATLLPNGLVLIFGGIGINGKVQTIAESFDPTTSKFQDLPPTGLTPRAYHSATVLTDGRILVAGGVSSSGDTLGLLELWNFETNTATKLDAALDVPRSKHTATLLANGTVLLLGGLDSTGSPLNFGEVFDDTTNSTFISTSQPVANQEPPQVEASLPADRSTNVPSNPIISMRFSEPLNMVSLNSQTVTLSGPQGSETANVVPAEGGRLVFLSPRSPLAAGTAFTVDVKGAVNSANTLVTPTFISFTTSGRSSEPSSDISTEADGDLWVPTASSFQRSWTSGHGQSPFQHLPALQARPGVTALAGQALRLSGAPLADVTLQIDSEKTTTDRTGRFLLTHLTAGHHILLIDGTTASTKDRAYGIFEVGVDLVSAKTTALDYTIWMTRLDTAHAVSIPSPTTTETTVSTPLLPGLELHLPPNTVIRDHNGRVVTQLSITPIPIDQPPFPLPPGLNVPIYFTIQPGDAYIDTQPGAWTGGAQLYYPNTHNAQAGTVFNFWNYDPQQKGWYVYGTGSASKDGKQIIPGPGVEIYSFTGAMVGSPTLQKNVGPTDDPSQPDGEPVDLSSGEFDYQKTDLVLPDVIPLVLKRTYTANDSMSRTFGIGAMQDYDIFLAGDTTSYSYIEMMLPDGARIYFYRTSSGTSYTGAVFAHTSTGSKWYGATITYSPQTLFPTTSWVLTTRDGMSYYFPDGLNQTNPNKAALLGIKDRYGNIVTISRDSSGNITQITSPNGRFITFQHDSSNRITQAQDNAGRTVGYTYDSSGRLSTVTDANSGVTTFTYDSNNNMLTVKDPRGIVYLTNQYDSNGRVEKQTLADGSTYQFAWTSGTASVLTFGHSGGSSGFAQGGSPSAVARFRTCSDCYEAYPPLVSQVDVTDPRGIVREVKYGSTGQMTSDTHALGTSDQAEYTYTYYADNLLESVTDPLSRTTTYSYDAYGDVTSTTRLSGTPDAVTTSMTYDPTFNQLTSVTDPLNHETTYSIDIFGNTTSITDALGHRTALTFNSAGQPLTSTDPLGHETQFGYTFGDLTSTIDPLGRTTQRFVDAAGRLTAVTDPAGNTTQYTYDNLNDLKSVTDALSGETSYDYDGNGNRTSVTDANSHTTSYTYDNMDRLETRTDPLTRSESYQYDGDGNLTQFTDRRGKVTTYTYDNLNRRTFAGFNTQAGPTYDSTIGYTYDAGNRLTQAVDSITGTITRSYDGLDRLTEETTPQGTVDYGYDTANRRTSMTVAGQSEVDYTYDNANRLTQITQGSSTVSLAYDNANRRASVTLPNGVVMSYGYDNGSQLTSIGYAQGTTNIGNLTYAYDLAGRRTSMGGSLAAVNLPTQISTTAYDAANELTQWGTATPTYDDNGNTTSDGTNSYVWDARNHLASMNSGADTFQYDPFGRRVAKTILGTTTNFLYDGANPAQELSGSTVTANLLTGLGVDERFMRTDSIGNVNFLTDALGSTLAVTDSSANTIASYSYDPFGSTTVTGSSTDDYEYTGRENDGTGVYYYRARYYNPGLQRFVSEDPIGFRGGINVYAYTGNSPVNTVDPSGQDWLNDLADFSAAAGAALTLGLTTRINDATGASSVVNQNSGWYTAGTTTGIALATTIGGEVLPSSLATLSNATKGTIGEGLSLVENTLSGSSLLGTQVSGEDLGLTTVFDSVWESSSGETYYVESKFGTSGLTDPQIAAQEILGDSYQVEQWDYDFFERIGYYLGYLYGITGAISGRK